MCQKPSVPCCCRRKLLACPGMSRLSSWNQTRPSKPKRFSIIKIRSSPNAIKKHNIYKTKIPNTKTNQQKTHQHQNTTTTTPTKTQNPPQQKKNKKEETPQGKKKNNNR